MSSEASLIIGYKTHTIEIPTTCIEFLTIIHPKWYAFINPPTTVPGDVIRFVNQGDLVREVIVERIAPPGELYEDEDFKGWTQVIFK